MSQAQVSAWWLLAGTVVHMIASVNQRTNMVDTRVGSVIESWFPPTGWTLLIVSAAFAVAAAST